MWAACGNEQCLEGAHVISLIRAISRHNIENSIVQPCGAVQSRSTTRRDFKYLQKEQPNISRLWPFRTARERHSHNRAMYTYTYIRVCVCVCTLTSTRARTSVSSPLCSPQLLILVSLFPTLFTRISERYRTSAAAFQLTYEYRSTFVMGHSSNDVIALNLYREQREKDSRKRQLPIIFRTWLEKIDRSPSVLF